ncbi:hypothetical protein ACFYOK_07770 [Microbispora bryophytorum]|uniref:hypothetical protein n=1 Tax=Microbispora bryophytorum TaxID=1460882 RepID=UPI0033D83BB0
MAEEFEEGNARCGVVLDAAPTDVIELAGYLLTTVGRGRWILNPRLPSQGRGMFTILNDRGAYVSLQRTVIHAEAPNMLARLDERLPGQIGQNNYLKCEISDEVLALLISAYEESTNRQPA